MGQLSIAANRVLLFLTTLGLGAGASCANDFNQVSSCGLIFNLPAHLRVTKPQRSVTEQGVAQCVFGVLPASKTSTPNAVCRDKDEGGSAPYHVCDWTTDGMPEERVVVAQTNLARDKKPVGAFSFTGNAWRLEKTSGTDGEAEPIDFFGKKAFQGEASHRTWWSRTKIKKYQSDFAGTGSKIHVLLQLSTGIAVSLESPPADLEDEPQCTVFCKSLRLAPPK